MILVEVLVHSDNTRLSYDQLLNVMQDYLLMLFHHIFTVLLLGMAFVVNGVQIATLILLAHDISDVPLEVKIMHRLAVSVLILLMF